MIKEIYEWAKPEQDGIFDNETGKTWDALELIREQDKGIKNLKTDLKDYMELEEKISTKYDNVIKQLQQLKEENQQLKDKLEIKLEELHIAYCGIENVKTKNGNLKAEVKQLKHSQKQLAIEELEKALVLIQNAVNLESPEYDLVGLYDAIVDQIKSLKGEEQ